MRYKIRYRRAKTEIIIESNDKAYIDKKLTELGAEPIGTRTKSRAPAKRTVARVQTKTAADLGKILAAMRGASNSNEIKRNVLDKRDRVGRILACYYFAASTRQPALTTKEVEALTGRLGARIAQPNVGKVIRLGVKRYLSTESSGAAVAYKINQQGRTAFENLAKGELS